MARDVAVLRYVLVPLLIPALTTLFVLTFVYTWNDFLLSLVVISTQDLRPRHCRWPFSSVSGRRMFPASPPAR